jgi:GxxExxY protein
MARSGNYGLLLEEEAFQIRGAIFHVHGAMGPGFLEGVYQECLGYELAKRGIPFAAEAPLRLHYEGRLLRQVYQPDFICFGKIILELKATRVIAPEHRAQLLNYLRASRLELGLLANFGAPSAQIERFALSRAQSA